MTRVKICGNTNLEDAKLAVSLGADYLGLIFAESKRRITPAQAQTITEALPDFKRFVGVFVNHPAEDVEAIAAQANLRILQFHGEEDPAYCQRFMAQGFQVIKTFRIKDASSLKFIHDYHVTAFLFDSYSKTEAGGTGISFDWNLLSLDSSIREKLFLAGGLHPANLQTAIDRVKPFAVDAVSGVEKTPGKKDPQLLKQFIHTAKGENPHAIA